MKGDNHLLALTTTVDKITGEVMPLFSFPVQVCKATDSGKDVKFDGAAPSGGEYAVQYIDKATGEVFDYEDRLRGVKVGDDFKPINEDVIEEINEATKIKTMVALGRLDRDLALTKYASRIKGKYFLQTPKQGGSATAYRLTYESLLPVMKGKKVERPAKAIVTKRTAKTRQQLALIYADEEAGEKGCLVMVNLEFAATMREPDAQILAPQTVEVEEAQVNMAREVVDGLAEGEGVIEAEIDEALPLRKDLIEKAIAGDEIVAPKKMAETVAKDNLADQLKASLAAAKS